MGDKKAIFLAAVVLIFSAFAALSVGAVRLSPAEILRGIMEGGDSLAWRVLVYVRLPRLFAAGLAGAGLAASGVLTQTVLANPLASPGIIGVNAGAGLTVAAAMAFLPANILILPLAAFAGAFAVLLLVYGIAKKAGASRITLVLSGVAISSLFSAGINTIAITHPDILRGLRDFQIGGFTGVTLRLLLPAGIVILLGIFAARLLAGELDILALGEQTAFSLGLNVKLYRFIFLALAALLAGAAVSFAGLVGFVGLIVPHMARIVLRGQQGNGSLLCLSALMGASFLILGDTAARTLFSPFELPVGILISFLGAPFFLWLLFRGKSHA